MREWVRSVEESNSATKARIESEKRQLEALHGDLKSARQHLQELQKLRAQQDKEAEVSFKRHATSFVSTQAFGLGGAARHCASARGVETIA